MAIFPVTHSTLSSKELGEFIKSKYSLPENYKCELFRTGMNHTYFLSNGKTKFVLRLYSYNWRSKSEIKEELTLINLLKEHHIPVSAPIPDKTGVFIQEISAPEGLRYAVLFSFASGEKVRFINNETCFSIGVIMAKMHQLTLNKNIERTIYSKKSLLEIPFTRLTQFFPKELPEMKFIKEIGVSIQDSDFENHPKGIIHLDIWYDNMAITSDNEITLFDFDFCGNGAHILDIGYFCKQLFHIEANKSEYQLKKNHFLDGYSSIRTITVDELKIIPKASLAVFVFYLGIQAQRFDWSNIFLTENYLKMYVGKLKSWIAYHDEK